MSEQICEIHDLYRINCTLCTSEILEYKVKSEREELIKKIEKMFRHEVKGFSSIDGLPRAMDIFWLTLEDWEKLKSELTR